jgi:hypothetical protein
MPGIHVRMLILKADSRIGDWRATETRGFNIREYHEYAKLFKITLEDVISRVNDRTTGSLAFLSMTDYPVFPYLSWFIVNPGKWMFIPATI